jgi:type VI secretion system protein ImpH
MGHSNRSATSDLTGTLTSTPSGSIENFIDTHRQSDNKNQLEINRSETISSPKSWPGKVRNYNFYQLVELLLRLDNQDPEGDDWEKQCKLLFSMSPSLGFAASDVTDLKFLENNYRKLETTFFGMSGAQSPLPSFLLEQLLHEDEQGVRKLFMDFFNHRLITLVYQVWRKYRYYLRFREGASDHFSAQLFALVGLADEQLRGDTPINWCKMLAYSGMLAGRSRSPQVVSGIIAHCFDLESVSIRQWELRYVFIPESQKMRLGKDNTSLGQDSVIGKQIKDRMGKFVICIEELTQSRFHDFLPTGKDHEAVIKLVTFILREQMAFDLELGLREDEAPAMRLGGQRSARLGWTSFTGQSQESRRVHIQIRQ